MTGYFYAPRRKISLPSQWIFCWMHLRPACTVRRSLRRRALFWPRALQPAGSRCGCPASAACGATLYCVCSRAFADKNLQNINRYFASGWNRDGLALRPQATFCVCSPGPAPRHLLIVLTDASPNDSRRIPPSPEKPLGCGYEDAAGVADTAAQVRALQRMASGCLPCSWRGQLCRCRCTDLRQKYARIRGMDQLARAAGRLIQNEIRELGD